MRALASRKRLLAATAGGAALIGALPLLANLSAPFASTAAVTPPPAALVNPLNGSTPNGLMLVHYRPGATAAAQAALEHSAGAAAVSAVPDLGVKVLRVPPAAEAHALGLLQGSGNVSYAEPDPTAHITSVTPNDPAWPNQWGSVKVGAPSAWSTTTGSSSVVIAVIDTGLTPGLTEFAGRVLPGYNFVANTTDTTDDNGHGTDVTGVAAAQGNNGTGVAGVCWSCRVLPVKVADANGNTTYDEIANGITWATDHGANVINISLAGPTDSATLDNAVTYAHSHNVVVVAGAGNTSCNCLEYPAASPGVLSVAATDSTDTLYSYSNYGSWVRLAAPGSNYTVSGSGSPFPFGGTSSASPVVAGAAALLLSADPGASDTAVEQALTSTGAPTSGGTLGGGRLNIAAALTALGVLTAASPSPSASPAPTPTPTVTPTSTPTASASPTPTQTSPTSPAPTPTAITAPTKKGGHKK